MASVTLGKKDKTKILDVVIGDKTYHVPLAGSLSLAEMRTIRTDDDSFAFFGKYIPKSVIESLSMDDLKTLTTAWKAESFPDKEDIDLGE